MTWFNRWQEVVVSRGLSSDVVSLVVGIIVGLLTAANALTVAAAGLTAMPRDIPSDPKQYLSKWDPFVLKPLIGTRQTLSRNNGRQIARNAAGQCFLLIEKDGKSLWLGLAAGAHAVGGDVQLVELVGPSPEAVFPAKGRVAAGSMVVDRDDRLHIVWTDNGTLFYAHRSLNETTLERLRQRSEWHNSRQLAEAPCDLGDIMLDAAGKPAVCYCRDDSVYYLPLGKGKPEVAGGAAAGMPPLVMPKTDRI